MAEEPQQSRIKLQPIKKLPSLFTVVAKGGISEHSDPQKLNVSSHNRLRQNASHASLKSSQKLPSTSYLAQQNDLPPSGFTLFLLNHFESEKVRNKVKEDQIHQHIKASIKKKKEEVNLKDQTMNITEFWNRNYKVDLMSATKAIKGRIMKRPKVGPKVEQRVKSEAEDSLGFKSERLATEEFSAQKLLMEELNERLDDNFRMKTIETTVTPDFPLPGPRLPKVFKNPKLSKLQYVPSDSPRAQNSHQSSIISRTRANQSSLLTEEYSRSSMFPRETEQVSSIIAQCDSSLGVGRLGTRTREAKFLANQSKWINGEVLNKIQASFEHKRHLQQSGELVID